MKKITLHILANSEGDCVADTDKDAAIERWKDELEGLPTLSFSLEFVVPEQPSVAVSVKATPPTIEQVF